MQSFGSVLATTQTRRLNLSQSQPVQILKVPIIDAALLQKLERKTAPRSQTLKVVDGKLLRECQDESSSGLTVGERFFDSGLGRWGTCIGFRPPEKALGAPIEVLYDGDEAAGLEPWIGHAMWCDVDQRQAL